MRAYTTEQRRYLLSFFKDHRDCQFTVEELTEQLCDEKGISRSAIYRNINKMVEYGMINRFSKDGSRKFLYQYIGDQECHDHLHFKCEKCGKIFHVEDPSIEKLIAVAMDQNDFNIDKKKTVLYGSCKTCH